MRAQTPAPLNESQVDAVVTRIVTKFEQIANRILAKLDAPCAATPEPDQLLDWLGVVREKQKLDGPGARPIVRQTVWKMVADGRLPQPCHRPNSRVARWSRLAVIAHLSKRTDPSP